MFYKVKVLFLSKESADFEERVDSLDDLGVLSERLSDDKVKQ